MCFGPFPSTRKLLRAGALFVPQEKGDGREAATTVNESGERRAESAVRGTVIHLSSVSRSRRRSKERLGILSPSANRVLDTFPSSPDGGARAFHFGDGCTQNSESGPVRDG